MARPNHFTVRAPLLKQLIVRPIIWASHQIKLTIPLAFGLLCLSLAILALYMTTQEILHPTDLWLNIGTELGGVGFTVLIVDQIYRQESQKAQKAQLIRELASSDNITVLRATRELEAHGWASQKHLQGIDLSHANLEHVSLSIASFAHSYLGDAILRSCTFLMLDVRHACLIRIDLSQSRIGLSIQLEGAMLVEANTTGTTGITEDEFKKAHSLWGAVMPDGSRYSGQFNLPGDLEMAKQRGVDITDQHALTRWYADSAEQRSWWQVEALLWSAKLSARQAGWRYKLENWMYEVQSDK